MRIVVLCALALALLGCTATKGTGGGWIPSTVPGEKATFGFEGHCDPRGLQPPLGCTPRGTGHYDDKAANVQMQLVQLGPTFGITCQGTTVEYRSTERMRPGSGTATVSVCDNDTLPAGPDVARLADKFSITVISGPYTGYTNTGFVLGGNIKIVFATPPPTP